ncbi:hypothetical protein Tco_1103510 [Tanacetum coccineum]
MAVNINFLILLQPEWTKYVTNVRLAKNLADVTYDALFDHLQQVEGIVEASRAKRAAKAHDPLALVANTYVREAIYDDQEDSLTSAMMFRSHATTQCYSTPTNIHLRTYLNIRIKRLCKLIEWIIKSKMLGMVVDMQEGHLVLKGSLLIIEMFRRTLGKETYREFYELHPLYEMLLMFNATTAMLKVTM